MKIQLKSWWLLSIIFLAIHIQAQEYRISKWLKDYPSATVITYDDWSPGHPTHGVAEHLRTNLPGTFYVTTGNAWREDDYINMDAAIDSVGLEIGNHTVTHPNLTGLNNSDLEMEVNGAKNVIDSGLNNQEALTFCYPLGAFNFSVRNKVMENHIASRGISLPQGGVFRYDFAPNEEDYFNLPTVTVNSNLSVNAFNNWIDAAINSGGLLTFMVHSISGEGVEDFWWDVIDVEYYRTLMNTLKSRSNDTWITTVKDAVLYHKQRQSASLDLVSENDSVLKLHLSDEVNLDAVQKHPLSIYLKIPDHDHYIAVEQNGEAIDFEIKEDSLVFNAVPGLGDIEIKKEFLLSAPSVYLDNELSIYPNPVNHTLHIKFEDIAVSNLSGRILNLAGQTAMIFKQKNIVDVSDLPAGVYFLLLETNDRMFKKRFVKL